MYCPVSVTFFTPLDELGMVLLEMWEVSNLPMGLLPYKEYFPYTEELAQLEKNEPALYETYRKLICHYYIYLNLHPSCGTVISLKSWVE